MANEYLPVKYSTLETLLEEDIPADDFKDLIIAIYRLHRYDEITTLKNPITRSSFREIVDFTRDKREKLQGVKERAMAAGSEGGKATTEAKAEAARLNGKLGGRPKKDNSEKNPSNILFGFSEGYPQEKNPSKLSKVNIKKSGNGNPETTTIISNFLNETQKAGFTLDRNLAGKILNTGINPSWLTGLFCFPEYAAQYIRGEYPDKPEAELRKLFISSFEWENLREEYPIWREQQQTAATLREQQEAAAAFQEQVRADIPKTCSNCGEPLDPDCQECPSCNWQYEFDDAKQEYCFYPPVNLKEAFQALTMRSGP